MTTGPRGAALMERRIGRTYQRTGNPKSAQLHLETALEGFLAVGDDRMRARALGELGDGLTDAGRPTHALEFFGQARIDLQPVGSQFELAQIMEFQARAYRHLEPIDHARELYETARSIYTECGDERRLADIDLRLAALHGPADGSRQ